LVATRVDKSGGGISAKRLLPIARAAAYEGSARNFRHLVAEQKLLWRKEKRKKPPKRGVLPNSSQLPPQALQPGFMAHVTSDLSHAHAVVFVVASGFVLTPLIPAAFLPKMPAADLPA
jgi:hypothetical protein